MSEENNGKKGKEEKKLNFHRAREYQGQGIAAFLVMAAALVLYFLLLRIQVFASALGAILHALSPALFGFIFAFILTPAVRFFEKYILKGLRRISKKTAKEEALKRRARKLSVFITLIFLLSIIAALLIEIIPEFIRSISNLATQLPMYFNSFMSYVRRVLENNPALSELVTPYIESATKHVEQYLANYLSSVLTMVYDWLSSGVMAAFRLVYNVFIGIIISIYLLCDTSYYLGICKKICFAVLSPKSAATMMKTMHKANHIYSSAILGKILDSTIIGLLCFIGTSILSLFFPTLGEYVALVSLIVGITNVIPFFGPYIGGVPCTLLIMCINPLHGVIFGVFLIVLQQFDCNFLDPHVVGVQVGLRPLFVLTACLLGAGLFGLPGMLVAVPTFAMIYSLLKSYFEVRLEAKSLPTETESYIGVMRTYFDANHQGNAGKKEAETAAVLSEGPENRKNEQESGIAGRD